MLFQSSDITTENLTGDLFEQKQVSISVLRLDKIHPVISGNKLFKLHYFLENALLQSYEGIVTFGGAWSNHLVATAYACKEVGLKCTGIIRGESPATLSNTLITCIEYGMDLKFISRQQYAEKESPLFLDEMMRQYKNYQLVPEGGYNPLGAAGARLIMDLVDTSATHICCAVGTATTLAGLLSGLKKDQQLIAIPVLKNMYDLPERITCLTSQLANLQQLQILNDYHFGGYAKKTSELLGFMNELYRQHQLPTDFVYTAKMMYGLIDSIKKDFFPKKSKIVCIHTGGLQGNLSLPEGSLVF